ncbi:MAG: class I SAM-dependent methyltransferase, partial [Microgenomates group bacterium]
MFDTKKIADTYDQIGLYFSATRPKLSAEAISLLPKLPSHASVLDLGCGNGVLLTALPKDISYTGLDISAALLKEAGRLHSENKFVLADITADSTWGELPKFDFIAALAVFHHLPSRADHLALLTKIKKHLAPGGSALISVWDLNSAKFDRLRQGKHVSIPFHGGPNRDFYAFGKDELTNLCRE